MSTVLILKIAVVIILVLTRPITVLIHELGHAFPACLLTKERVSVYAGSYGSTDDCFRFRIGRIYFYLKKNPFTWLGGLCMVHSKKVSINSQIFITLVGPLTSLMVGALCCYVAIYGDFHGSLKIISVIFLGSSMYDFFTNIVPSKQSMILHDGTIVYNDGQQLIHLIRHKTFPYEYRVGAEYYNNGQFVKAAKKYQSIIDQGIVEEDLFRFCFYSYYLAKDFDGAAKIILEFEKHFNPTYNDLCVFGDVNVELGMKDDALLYYRRSLEMNPNNSITYNNRGYFLLRCDDIEDAISDLDRAISLDPQFAFAFNNRGYAKIIMERYEEGLEDLNRSMELDNENSYCYRNFGIYHYNKGNYRKALNYFRDANKIDENTDLLKEYLSKTIERLN